jgi:hypothetical protein
MPPDVQQARTAVTAALEANPSPQPIREVFERVRSTSSEVGESAMRSAVLTLVSEGRVLLDKNNRATIRR